MGTVVHWQQLSPILSIFRLMPEDGSPFPGYKAGQYIALRRDDCRLTKRTIGEDGKPRYVPDLDEERNRKVGPVTHSYSISSAPFETERNRWLEFYVVLEEGQSGEPGRLTESLFRIHPGEDDKVGYVDRIAGDFTGWESKSIFLLENGQRWQVANAGRYYTPAIANPKVKIIPAAMGGFWMSIEGVSQRVKVIPVGGGK